MNSYKGSGMSGIYHFQQSKRSRNTANKKQKPFDAEGYVDEITGSKNTDSSNSELYRYHD